ncbi:MAG: RNase adapter RapZ, partial [Sphingomicrobium sp.]
MTEARQRSLPQLLLVTGMSGAGKSTVLDALEDMGWDTVENLPAAMLANYVAEMLAESSGRPIAVGMDARSRGFAPAALPAMMRSIDGVEAAILYLDCSGAELTRRYDATRRRHPLAPDRPPEDGIARERNFTAALR